jgi:serpin B
MADVLHFTLPEQNLYSAFGTLQKQLIQKDKSCGYQLLVANALWGQKGEPFLKEFLDLTKCYYGAGLNQLDFVNETEKSRQIINSWVEEKTNNKIKELILQGGVDEHTALVLTNAIYFKGDWKTKFSKWKTRKPDFAVSAKDKVKVPMMHLKEDFKYYADEKLQILELPYKGNEISMLVLLPSDTEGIREVENTLTTESLNILQSKMWMTKVDVYFPKFKMTWGTFSLKNALVALGMPDAFDGRKADFSGINGIGGLWISGVFHKAFIEVNEKGTEAAAATGVGIAASIHTEPPVFRADHPFIFIIKDNRSGSILFMGRAMNPAK